MTHAVVNVRDRASPLERPLKLQAADRDRHVSFNQTDRAKPEMRRFSQVDEQQMKMLGQKMKKYKQLKHSSVSPAVGGKMEAMGAANEVLQMKFGRRF